MTAVITVEGQTLHLLPERAIYWEEANTLLVADPHWGKAATFRSAGLFVPRGTTTSSLARLDLILSAHPTRRIIFLGDFLHAKEGRAAKTLGALADWRESRTDLELVLVRGNHDRHAGDPPNELRIECVNAPLLESGLAFTHHPGVRADGFVLAGHIHPAVRLVGRGRQRKRLPCFWFCDRMAVLPAFGEFTGLGIVDPAPRDRVFVIADSTVVEVSG